MIDRSCGARSQIDDRALTSLRHSAAERRDDVLDAALVEFAERGLEGTSTEDIARRVETIQTDTSGAVEAIGQISAIITSINDYQLTIASAVEEQTATTNEMSRNVTEAATGSGEIASNIIGVASAASTTTQAVTQTQAAIDELARMAADLRTEVARFTY